MDTPAKVKSDGLWVIHVCSYHQYSYECRPHSHSVDSVTLHSTSACQRIGIWNDTCGGDSPRGSEHDCVQLMGRQGRTSNMSTYGSVMCGY